MNPRPESLAEKVLLGFRLSSRRTPDPVQIRRRKPGFPVKAEPRVLGFWFPSFAGTTSYSPLARGTSFAGMRGDGSSWRGPYSSPLCHPGVFGRLKDVIEPRAKEEKDEFREGRPAMDKRDEEKSGGGNAQKRN